MQNNRGQSGQDVRQSAAMGKGPEDAPLGATPMLPAPSGAAADRASVAFSHYMDELRHAPVAAVHAHPSSEAQPAAQTGGFGGGRRYDLALAKAGLTELEVSELEVSDNQPTLLASEQQTESVQKGRTAPASDPPPVRPPPGAPTVRPSVANPPGVEAVPQELLQTAADSALLTHNPDGTAEFDIAFSDELFHELACKVKIGQDGRVVATFRVHDVNLRRLLEAESGRLRIGLEQRGLKVAEIRVETEG